VPDCSSYVWRYGAQYNGVDGRPGESGFRPGALWRALCLSRSGFEGGALESSVESSSTH
jgi:hypothetical protein